MIIDSPIISGSSVASGSLNQLGNVTITGSVNVSGSFTSTGTITAQTLVVQTVTSSTVYSSGSNIFGNSLANTQVLTGSVSITGSLAVNGSNVVLSNQTSSMSASYALNATSASYANNATTASYANTSTSASYSNNSTSASYANNATSASYAANATTSSYSNNSTSASYANNATTASYALVAAAGGFPYTGSAQITGSLGVTGSVDATSFTGSLLGTSSYAVYSLTSSYSLAGSGFPFSGSAVITGSLLVTNLSSSGVSYLVADAAGFVTAQTASAAIKSTQAVTSTAGQTSFNITNGYTTGLVDVYINGTKLSAVEYTDTSGTVITLATGSNNGDTVEFVKYFPASGVTNNALRQQTTITASAGQTVFSASYTPGLLDIYYNGSRLSTSDYTANSGTYFTLATASAASDILDILVYSYQVGAFSGIGGAGVASQVAYFDTTNSITGSPNFTISGSTMLITGSLTVSGSGTFTNIGPAVFSGSITSTAGFTGSFSGTATSASYAANAELLDGLDSTVFTLTSSFIAQTASFTAFTSSINSFSASILAQTASLNAFSASVLTFTGSAATRLGALEAATSSLYSYTSSLNNQIASFATTGSNTFIGTQTISGSVLQSGSFTTTGTIIAQTINVQQVTSSVIYSSGSNIFGNLISNTQVFTGSVLITGSLTIAGASSATSYSGTTIYGSTAVCSPVGKFTTCLDLGGALTGTSATFNNNSTSNAGFFQINDGTTTLGNSFATVHRNANDGNGRFSLSRWQVQNASGLDQSAFIGTQAVTGASNYNPNLILGISTGASSYATYLTIASTGVATFACQVCSPFLSAGDGTQCNADDAPLTIKRGVGFAGLDFKSLRTTGNIGGIRFYDCAGILQAQQLIEVDGSFNFYNATSNNRFKIASTGVACFSNTICACNLDLSNTGRSTLRIFTGPADNEPGIELWSSYPSAAERNWRIGTSDLSMGDFVIKSSITCGGSPDSGCIRLQINNAGAACFACELTAKTIGTNDLLLNNLNYECANYVDGTRGSWLIQEGACDLFIINQMSCKKYKFNLIEIK